MLTKELEQTRKDYPAKIKSDNASIIAFYKALTSLPKASTSNFINTFNISLLFISRYGEGKH